MRKPSSKKTLAAPPPELEPDWFASAVRTAIEIEERQACEESFYQFVQWSWPLIEPANPLVLGYPLEAICDHLQAVSRGWIKHLLITVPPGFSKSLCTAVLWPAFEWGPARMPHLRYISASYAENLSVRDNQRCRRLVCSEAYQARWPLAMVTPQSMIKFENAFGGWKLATSVGGALLGHRGDRILCDDPNSPQVESETIRKSTGRWFLEVVPTRTNNENCAFIIIQQRLHMEDVAGLALEQGDYCHLNIAMEYEPRLYVNAFVPGTDEIRTFVDDEVGDVNPDDIFWQDWRQTDGELAWPERFSLAAVDRLKHTLGPIATAGMLQQSPIPRGGGIIKSAYWQPWNEPKFPPFEFVLASLDTAYTSDKQNDPSGLTVWGLHRGEDGYIKIFLVYAWTEWLEFHELVQRVIKTCTVDPLKPSPERFAVDRLLVENKASGKSVAQELWRLTSRLGSFAVDLIDPRNADKLSRLISVENFFAAGMVYAPDRKYADQVIDQLANFPHGSHDEFVDTTSMALRWLRDNGMLQTTDEAAEERMQEMQWRPRMAPLYPV